MTTVLDASALDGTTDGGSDNSVTFRIVISAAALAAASGNQAQVVFRSGNPSGSASPTISGAFIGQAASAGSLNFSGNQVRLTFAGGNTANVTAANQNVTSDVVTLGETFDNTKDYIVSFRFDVGASAPTTTTGLFSNVNAQFLLASTAGEEGNTTAAGGYTAQAGTDQFLRQIFITGGASGGIASGKRNFNVNKFKKAIGLGPNAGLFQVRAYPIAASTAQPDTSGQVIYRVRNQPWRW